MSYLASLKPKGELDFYREFIGDEFPSSVGDAPDRVMVINDEKVAERMKCPAQSDISSQLVALGIILRNAAYLQLRREIQLQPAAEQLLGEFFIHQLKFFEFLIVIWQRQHRTGISFHGKFQTDKGRRFPQ